MQLNDGSRDLVAGVDFIPRQPASPYDQRHRNLVTLDATNREMLNHPSSAALVRDYFLNQKDVMITLVELSSGVICRARGKQLLLGEGMVLYLYKKGCMAEIHLITPGQYLKS